MSRLYSPKAWLLSLAGACVLAGWPVKEARAAVTCTATMTGVDFGSVDLVAGVGLSASGTLNYTCTNDATALTYVRVCFNIGDGNESLGFFNPRRMTSAGNVLQFQIYHTSGSTIWGSNGNTVVPNPFIANLAIPRRSGGNNGSISGSTAMQGVIPSGQTAVPPGSYQDFFSAAGGHTSISWTTSTTSPPSSSTNNCSGTTSGSFPFTVRAAVIKSCTVTAGAASNIQLGAAGGVDATATNIMGNNTIGVTCSSGTPYFIGLRPSNNNSAGLGRMVALNIPPVTGNTDTIPYQLRSAAGMTGQIWGNTATATAVGNGVARTGTGANQNVTVYATTPNANFTPDSYADTVTVIVNY
jgi:spore coat protein U-like protein